MSKLVVSIGISGVGKTTYYEKNFPNYVHVCPDKIRKELTGNISDQSKNGEVWRKAYFLLEKKVSSNEDVYFDATNCSKRTIKEICASALKFPSMLENVTFLIFMDSYNWEKCRSRIRDDLKNNKDRSNTDITQENGSPLIFNMSQKFINFIDPQQDGFWNALKEMSVDFSNNMVNFEVKWVKG